MCKNVLNVTSEIGKLEAVLLHRPGREIENLVPEYLERLLFDDIPYLKVAQKEYDIFAGVLRENGVEVYYVEKLMAEVIQDQSIKEDFVNQFLDESNIETQEIKSVLYEYLIEKDTNDLVDTVIAGVRKSDLPEDKTRGIKEVDKDKYHFFIDPMPNLYFTRDIGAVIGNGITINKMKTAARKRETLFTKFIYENHPMFKQNGTKLLYDRDMPYTIEGGDELVLSNEVVAIGSSARTSKEAIETVAKNLFKEKGFKKVLMFDIPKCRAFMHLDTVFTMVDYDKFTIHPGILEPMEVYTITPAGEDQIDISYDTNTPENILKEALHLSEVDLIICGGGDPIVAAREQWNDGSNTLAIAPGVVITYERNYVSNELLEKHGAKVITMPSSELSRGRGGPRCMSMPLIRKDIE